MASHAPRIVEGEGGNVVVAAERGAREIAVGPSADL
jgi:hypothetical protein